MGTRKQDMDRLLADFAEWNGGFEPADCELDEVNTYLAASIPADLDVPWARIHLRAEAGDANARRARDAMRALEQINQAGGDRYEAGDLRTPMVDLLSNLMHFCRQSNIDFDAAMDTARGHFGVERE